MIGDGIATDLAAARAVGARCIFMLTGVTTRAQLDALPDAEQPTAVAADAAGAGGGAGAPGRGLTPDRA